ncbi:hypothetical protein QK428_28390, partial [Pseudomonas aeruginosa]|nr:hypothetical protein [Pseudomonas aeruginosa]
MQTNTLQKYQTRARNFYREHCKSEAPDSAQICAALLAQADQYRPNSFGTLKSVSVWPTHLPDPSCSRHGVHLFLVDT